MQSPSTAILINEVDMYVSSPAVGRDLDGGPKWTYATTPTYRSVPCMLEADDMYELVDDQQRVTQYLVWYIMTGERCNLPARSKIIYVDDAGDTHTLFAEANRGEAERGGAYTIRAVEQL